MKLTSAEHAQLDQGREAATGGALFPEVSKSSVDNGVLARSFLCQSQSYIYLDSALGQTCVAKCRTLRSTEPERLCLARPRSRSFRLEIWNCLCWSLLMLQPQHATVAPARSRIAHRPSTFMLVRTVQNPWGSLGGLFRFWTISAFQ